MPLPKTAASDPAGNPSPDRGLPAFRHSLNVLENHNYYYYASMHLGCLAVIVVGVDATAVLLCIGLFAVRMLAITAGYHRYFSHRSYKTSRTFQFVLGLVGCTAFQYDPIRWAGVHRHHHRHSDMPKDLHSPRHTGFWWSHLGWVLPGPPALREEDTGSDFCRYPALRWLDRHFRLPPAMLAAGCFLAGGWSGFVWGFVVS